MIKKDAQGVFFGLLRLCTSISTEFPQIYTSVEQHGNKVGTQNFHMEHHKHTLRECVCVPCGIVGKDWGT